MKVLYNLFIMRQNLGAWLARFTQGSIKNPRPILFGMTGGNYDKIITGI